MIERIGKVALAELYVMHVLHQPLSEIRKWPIRELLRFGEAAEKLLKLKK